MAEIKEALVDRDGEVVGYHVTQKRGGAGFVTGMILGAVLIAIGIVAFSYSRGGFEVAGRDADVAAAAAEETLADTASDAGAAVEDVRDPG